MKSRKRTFYIFLFIVIFIIDVLILFVFDEKAFIRGVVGDFTVAMLLYLFFVIIWRRLAPWTGGLLVLAITLGIEGLQFLGVPKLFNPDSLFVELVLGSTFDPRDILAYIYGTLCIAGVDMMILQAQSTKKPE